MLRLVTRLGLALAAAVSLSAQQPTQSAPLASTSEPLHEAGRNVTISLLTMGNGEEVWERFGHSAIWIHDNANGRDTVFNWGVFDPRRPYFIPHFLQGLMLYEMGGESLERVLLQYRYFNRTVMSQELALTTAQKDSLLHLIQINAQPENLQYRYDYFRDNCSTRPRDLLDGVLGGLLRANSSQVTNTSYRWHATRLMQGEKALVVGVDIGLGEPSDKPITRWQAMFLPRELHDLVATLRIPDSAGMTKPLVVAERVLYQSTRAPEPDAPPNFTPPLLAIGLVLAGLFLWLGARAADGGQGARRIAAVVLSLWSLVAGLLGVLLTLLWTVTDHVFAHQNENLLLFNPLWLVLAVLLLIHLWTGRAARATRLLAFGLAALSVVALLAHLVLLSRQVNVAIVGLALPPALAIAWIVRQRREQH